MQTLTFPKWFYPLIYLALVIIAFLPLYTERPYDPRETQQVIFEIISRAALPYAGWGWVFHVATLAVMWLWLFGIHKWADAPLPRILV